MKNHYLVSLFLIVCLSFSNTLMASRKPDWVKQRPNDPAFYIGISMSDKQAGKADYRSEARSQALKQLSSEIKVTVSSNSVLHQIENDFQFKEQYESKINTSVQETLEGYEVLTWEDKKEYWVMTRLSKQKYERAIQMKLDQAKMMASSYLGDAKKALANNDAYAALSLLAKATISIKNHLEEDLTYRSVDGTYNVGTEVFNTIQMVFQRISLVPSQSTFLIQFSKQVEVPIGVNAFIKTEQGESLPLRNFPLEFRFTKGEGLLTTQVKTNYDGHAKVAITRLISKRKMQEIAGTFDMSYLTDANTDEDTKRVLQVFFSPKIMPTATISVEVQKSTAYLLVEERVFDENQSNGIFSTMIKSELNENFFSFTGNKEDAEFVVKLKSSFVKGEEKKGQGYSLFIVFAHLSLSITDAKTGVEVFSDGLSGPKGSRPGSFDYALKEARLNALSMFKSEMVPRLEQVDM